MDAGQPIVVLGGVHAGCDEPFGSERVRSIRDLTAALSPSERSGPAIMSIPQA
jgi:hypothetical protein